MQNFSSGNSYQIFGTNDEKKTTCIQHVYANFSGLIKTENSNLHGAEIRHYPAGQVGTAHEKYLLTLGTHGFISKVDSSLSWISLEKNPTYLNL